MEWLIGNFDVIKEVVTGLVTIAAFLSAVWGESRHGVLNKLRAIINVLAINFGKAKNAK